MQRPPLDGPTGDDGHGQPDGRKLRQNDLPARRTRMSRPWRRGRLPPRSACLPGTVTSMLKTLDESNLATYTPYEGVRLTPAGRALALRVVRRHRLIEQFLVETLQLSWDEVHEEAENMEHAVSDWLVDRIDAVLGYPQDRPARRADPQGRRHRGRAGRPTARRLRGGRTISRRPRDRSVAGLLAVPVAGRTGDRHQRLARGQ